MGLNEGSFKDDEDRKAFLDRLADVLDHTQTQCYAWALIPNHFHALLRTGPTPLSKVMRHDIRRYKPGHHCGVLLLRLHDEGKRTMLSYLEWLLHEHEIENWTGCLVIATDHKLRVKRPQQ